MISEILSPYCQPDWTDAPPTKPGVYWVSGWNHDSASATHGAYPYPERDVRMVEIYHRADDVLLIYFLPGGLADKRSASPLDEYIDHQRNFYKQGDPQWAVVPLPELPRK